MKPTTHGCLQAGPESRQYDRLHFIARRMQNSLVESFDKCEIGRSGKARHQLAAGPGP
ncbi:hypothetical protein H8B02_43650 [Bradyrhizobium sp. Pear77]|uniref:hypothetical protein n=1 Tax=Bradyrhizobium altum TaxID=1571202 RepID=UPI001E335C0E|nr:hypothetical protein [Bradyrhizobium altum]MCC8960059.1 hypothetical protein [Bradyrhizobium altum]